MPPPAHPPTPPPPLPEPPHPSGARVLILGADALLAALPATAVQLAHACMAAGFDSVVPASWGDELVAAAYLEELARRGGRPAICCSCPLVAARLASYGDAPSHAVISLVPPPVAAARYLRLMAGDAPLHVTYAGGCPLGGELAIDEQLSPGDLLEAIAARGVSIMEQPTAYEGILPPDRRRHLSLPGGVPSPAALAARALPYRLLELTGDDYATELAGHLLGGDALLLDLAPRLGCACSGAVHGVAPTGARQLVAALEPPRSPVPVLDPMCRVEVRGEPARRDDQPEATRQPAPPTVSPTMSAPAPAPAPAQTRATATPPGARAVGAGGVSRRTPIVLPRVWAGAFPRARTGDGQLLPRAYVAHRQSYTSLATISPPPPPPYEIRRDEGGEYSTLVAGLRLVLAESVPAVEGWRSRLDDAIARWEERGYETAVLRRARALPSPPDMEGLLRTFVAAVDRLRQLESLAAAIRPSLWGAPIFRDPTTVRAAEELVDGILGSWQDP